MSKDQKMKKPLVRKAFFYADENLTVPVVPSAIKVEESMPAEYRPQNSIRPMSDDKE